MGFCFPVGDIRKRVSHEDRLLASFCCFVRLLSLFAWLPFSFTQNTGWCPTSPVCLSIQDAGIGIPPDELPLLFEKFVRLKRDLAGTTRGTGLGLYICKQLVQGMDGSIWVESSGRPGEGCRFCVTLPSFPASITTL
jgi:signal transduction histidine kinase